MHSQIQTRARALFVLPLLLNLAACGSGDDSAPTPMGNAQQATAAQESKAAGEQQTNAVYVQLTPKLSDYESVAGVNFLASAPVDLNALKQAKVTDPTTARRTLSSPLQQTKLLQTTVEGRYGTWDAEQNLRILPNDPPNEIVVEYDSGIKARFYQFTFANGYVTGYKLQVTSPPALANTSSWVEMDLTVTLSDLDASGIPSTVRYAGPVSFWYDDPATAAVDGAVQSFNIDFRLTLDASSSIVDLLVTDSVTGAYWHSVIGTTLSQPAANIDRVTMTWNYNDSNTVMYALTFVTDTEWVDLTPTKMTMTASGGAYFQGVQVGIVSGGPLVIDLSTGMIVGLPITMTWTNGDVDFVS